MADSVEELARIIAQHEKESDRKVYLLRLKRNELARLKSEINTLEAELKDHARVTRALDRVYRKEDDRRIIEGLEKLKKERRKDG